MTDDTMYSATPMRRGGWRVECHVEGCWVWLDFEPEFDKKGKDLAEKAALSWLASHMHKHRIRVTRRRALSTSGG